MYPEVPLQGVMGIDTFRVTSLRNGTHIVGCQNYGQSGVESMARP